METYKILYVLGHNITDLCSEGSDHEKQPKEPKRKPSRLAAPAPDFMKKENATLSQ